MKKMLLLLVAMLVMQSVRAQNVTFGIISDVHEDLQPDASVRLQKFVDESNAKKVDFVVDLGDLCHSTGADKMLAVYKGFKGPVYHAFGNHDMDHATKAAMTKKYGMPAGHYYFDKKGVRFIVLDCGFTRKNGKLVDYDNGDYFVDAADRDLITPEEIEWTRQTIMSTDKPCLIFSHQAFDEIGASVPNRAGFRAMLRQVNADRRRVIAMVCGHHHIDAHTVIDGIDYIQINSASYQWIESGHKYSNGCMAEYKDPLYAFVTIDVKRKLLTLKGKTTEFKAPAPKPSDFSGKWRSEHTANREWQFLEPVISDRVISFAEMHKPSPFANVQSENWIYNELISDEFEGTALDTTKWFDHNPGWLGREPSLFKKENVTVCDGKLTLTGRREELKDAPKGYHTFSSAAVQSKQMVLYGFFEIKCRPMKSALSSAFWLYTQDSVKQEEIDIFEICGRHDTDPSYPKTYFATSHYIIKPNDVKISDHVAYKSQEDLADQTIVAGLKWTRDEIVWYLNGNEIRRRKNDFWHSPESINFDSEAFPSWWGLPSDKDFGGKFEIEYFRYWRENSDREQDGIFENTMK